MWIMDDWTEFQIAYIQAHDHAILTAPKDDDETWGRLCREAAAGGWRMYGLPRINGPWKEAILIREKHHERTV